MHSGLSACAGFRCGALYTYNTNLLKAYSGMAHFSTVSSVTQWHLLGLLEDTEWVDAFVASNRALLETLCGILTQGLAGMGVKFTQPQVRTTAGGVGRGTPIDAFHAYL